MICSTLVWLLRDKSIGYYVTDLNNNNNNNTWNIRKQAVGYMMFLKRQRSAKVKTKGCVEGHYHQKFNHELESSSHVVTLYFHVRFLCDEYNRLKLQTKECDWMRR